jgi:hypothetical protein
MTYKPAWCACVAAASVAPFFASLSSAQGPSVTQIIGNSLNANQRDFEAAPHFNWKERDRTPAGSKTYQVTMIDGTPYNRLIAENGRALSPDREQQEIRKQEQETQKRLSESADARRQRIEKFDKERRRNNNMMDQLTEAFDFRLIGTKTARGFHVWVLKATPRPGYKPPNIDAQVLPGMQGELWIDQKTFQWVHVHAIVMRPVTIAGFLARVEPGTEFDLQNMPVGNGIWQASHFSMRSQAKVLFMFNHNSQEDDTYWDYQPVS